MPTSPRRADPPDKKIPCEVCEKEVPIAEAFTTEVEDYFLYFCGAECFDHWRKKAEKEYGEHGSR